jgi:hypothetical protein
MTRSHASLCTPPSGIKGSSTNGTTLWEKIFVAGGEKKERILEDMQLILNRDSRSLISHSSRRDRHLVAVYRSAAPGYDSRSQHFKTGLSNLFT